MSEEPKPRRIGYLSSAPRVSTRADAEATGVRARVVGVVEGFRELGWPVETFIVGDRVPVSWVRPGSEQALSASMPRRLAGDLMRIGMGAANARRAWGALGGGVDWIYEHLGALQSLGWIFQRSGLPWILETDAPQFIEAREDRKTMVLSELARRRELEAYRTCDVLVCISEALKEILVEIAGVPRDKILVVPNAADLHRFDCERSTPRRYHVGGVSLGFVGALSPWQDLGKLLATTKLLRDSGRDLRLTIAGDGPERARLEQQVAELDLGEVVEFPGRIPWADVPDVIAGVDFAYSGPRRLEVGRMYHSPLKLYEYLAMGKPVVAAAHDDARGLIRDGDNGFLFTPEDSTDLKAALSRAYDSAAELPKMGVRGRERIEEEHTWRDRAREIVTGSERILTGRGSG